MSDSLREDPYYEDFPEEERSYSTHIVARRFYVFLEIFMAMLVNFLLLIGFGYILNLIPDTGNPYFGLFEFFFSLLAIILSTVVSLVFIQLVFYRNKMPLKEADPPLKETRSLFTFKKFGIQLLFTFLLLFLVYIPLDFLTYSIPGGLEFSRRSLGDTGVNVYLGFFDFVPFIIYGAVLHLMVGIREEVFFRGLLSVRSDKYLNLGSSVVITSMYFALSHFTYIFYSTDVLNDILPAIIWTLGAFFVGSVSAVFILKTRLIWPIILAHTLNNIISSSVLWLTTIQNVNFWDIALWLYLPLTAISIILAVIFFREVKNGVKTYFGAFKSYKTEIPEQKTRVNIIVADILFGLIFWAVGMFLI